MSDVNTAGAPQGQPQGDGAAPTIEQLRSMPAEQVVVEVLSVLLNAAQVKLGRRDARLLIDLSNAVTDQARACISADLAKQVDQALGQLRLGQVEAERAPQRDEPNDLAEMPKPSASSTTTAASQQQPSAASKLWIPGRP